MRSGAEVFSTGTMTWVPALRGASERRRTTRAGAAFARRTTDNLLRAMSEGPRGRQHSAVDNLDAMRLPTRNTTGAA
ncbi:MAG: hypothetical protein M3P46_11200 [Actinomycetota bacterium]|nr:hypothetical protein [Actinomycetota bacterium]